jgi:hypothetical protein
MYKLIKDLHVPDLGITYPAGSEVDLLISELPRLRAAGYIAPETKKQVEIPAENTLITASPAKK